MAALPADLAADAPDGPRFTASTEQGELPDPAALFAEAQDQSVSVRGAAVQVTVDGIEGVSLEYEATIDGATINSRQVVVPLGGGRAASFILEAPADQWEANQAALTAILASVHSATRPEIVRGRMSGSQLELAHATDDWLRQGLRIAMP